MKKTLYLVTLSLACIAATPISRADYDDGYEHGHGVVGGIVGGAVGAVTGAVTGVVEGTVEGARAGAHAGRGEHYVTEIRHNLADSQGFTYWEINNNTHREITLSSGKKEITLNPGESGKLPRTINFNITVRHIGANSGFENINTITTKNHFVTVKPPRKYFSRGRLRFETER